MKLQVKILLPMLFCVLAAILLEELFLSKKITSLLKEESLQQENKYLGTLTHLLEVHANLSAPKPVQAWSQVLPESLYWPESWVKVEIFHLGNLVFYRVAQEHLLQQQKEVNLTTVKAHFAKDYQIHVSLYPVRKNKYIQEVHIRIHEFILLFIVILAFLVWWQFHGVTYPLQKFKQEAKRLIAESKRAQTVRSSFLAAVNHEIRTPMNGILGMLHLLEKTSLNAEQQKYIATAHHSSQILLALIDDVLDYSKMDSGALDLENQPFDLLACLAASADLFVKNATENNIKIICDFDTQVPRRILGDKMRLQRVINNLLSNAFKFTDQGWVRLRLRVYANCYVIGVQDTGMGIAFEKRCLLFKAFTQLDESYTRKFGGTGLGLAISQHLVTQMGGKIRVKSQVDKGSYFYFSLPLTQLDPQRDYPPFTRGLSQYFRIFLITSCSLQERIYSKMLGQWNLSLSCLNASSTEIDCLLQKLLEESQRDDRKILFFLDQGADKSLLERLRMYPKIILVVLKDDLQDIQAMYQLETPVYPQKLYATLYQILTGDLLVKPSSVPPLTLQPVQVLLVEDNPVNQKVAISILRDLGLEVTLCENGAQAVQKITQYHFDLVFMDIQMPIMDGLTATKKIRALGGEYAKLPIIAMTAHALAGDAQVSLAAGMNDHVTKPIDPDYLSQVIQYWTNQYAALPTKSIPNNTQEKHSAIFTSLCPVIDIQDGLRRLRGKYQVYEEILVNFYYQYAQVRERINADISAQAWQELGALIHTIKGSSANLGAKQLAADALALEAKLKAEQTALRNLSPELESFQQSLQVLIQHLASWVDERKALSENKAIPAQVSIDPIEIYQGLQEVKQVLYSDYASAITQVEQLLMSAQASRYQAPLEQYLRVLRQFDMDVAEKDLEKLLENFAVEVQKNTNS